MSTKTVIEVSLIDIKDQPNYYYCCAYYDNIVVETVISKEGFGSKQAILMQVGNRFNKIIKDCAENGWCTSIKEKKNNFLTEYVWDGLLGLEKSFNYYEFRDLMYRASGADKIGYKKTFHWETPFDRKIKQKRREKKVLNDNILSYIDDNIENTVFMEELTKKILEQHLTNKETGSTK